MTDHAPIDQPIVEILNAYNPLEIKDILLHGSWRKATKHKDWADVLAYYQSLYMIASIWQVSSGILTMCLSGRLEADCIGQGSVTKMFISIL